MGFSLSRSLALGTRASRGRVVWSAALLTFIFSGPAFGANIGVAPDPALESCGASVCLPPEPNALIHEWTCPGNVDGQRCPKRGHACLITKTHRDDPEGVDTGNTGDQQYIKCTCKGRGTGEGPIPYSGT